MIRQGDCYVARGLFRLGRRTVRPGDVFWVTSPAHTNSDTVLLEREGRGTIGAGVRVSVADLGGFFDKQQ